MRSFKPLQDMLAVTLLALFPQVGGVSVEGEVYLGLGDGIPNPPLLRRLGDS